MTGATEAGATHHRATKAAAHARTISGRCVVDKVGHSGREISEDLVGVGLGEVLGSDLGVDLGRRLSDDRVDHVLSGLALADGEISQ